MTEARQRAQTHADPITAAQLLLEVGDEAAAESALVDHCGEINGNDYPRLVPLAEAFEERHRVVAATVCYRALLLGILSRAYVRAYRHAARYLVRLRHLATETSVSPPLESHEAFEAALKARHARKAAFWNHVKAS